MAKRTKMNRKRNARKTQRRSRKQRGGACPYAMVRYNIAKYDDDNSDLENKDFDTTICATKTNSLMQNPQYKYLITNGWKVQNVYSSGVTAPNGDEYISGVSLHNTTPYDPSRV